jgi:hypothetical protein
MTDKVSDPLDEQLDLLLAGSSPHAPEFRLKLRELINSELADMREELHDQVKIQLDNFMSGFKTQLTNILTESSIAAAKRTKAFVERELLVAQSKA